MTETLPKEELRERIARLIEPVTFQAHASMWAWCEKNGEPTRYADEEYGARMKSALAKADSILSLISTVRGEGDGSPGVENAASLPAEADCSAAQSLDGWRPICEAVGRPGAYINVRSVTTYRWLEYKPDGKRQMGKAGRWQMAVGEYGGWQNAPLPERSEFRPQPEGEEG